MATIPTTAEVLALTAVPVTEAQIATATGIIELYAGREPGVWDQLTSRDRRSLKLAVAYQAAWVDGHPELFASMDVAHFQQLDQRVDPRSSDAVVLAPLAHRALKRLSWRGVRSLSLTTDFQRKLHPEDYYQAHVWEPLP